MSARRRSHIDMPAAYASIGATRDPDLLRFPPAGSTPYHEEVRLGSGEDRFITASSLLMTWGAQRGAGMTVEIIERGPDDEYEGIEFDADGIARAAGPREDTYGPDGEPYLNAGTSLTLSVPGRPQRSLLVIYTVDEARVVGFAWGTGDEAGAVGEQRFTVERREDDTVWAVARGFLTPPKNGLLGLKARAELRAVIDEVKQQIQALSPVVASVNAASSESATGAEAPGAAAGQGSETDDAAPEAAASASAAEQIVVPESEPVEPETPFEAESETVESEAVESEVAESAAVEAETAVPETETVVPEPATVAAEPEAVVSEPDSEPKPDSEPEAAEPVSEAPPSTHQRRPNRRPGVQDA